MANSDSLGKKEKIIFSAVCYLSILTFGSGYGMLSSSLQDIVENTHSQFEDVSHALVVNAVFCSLGFLAWGKVFSVMDRRPFVILSLFVHAAVMIAIPFVRSLPVLWVIFACFGFTVITFPFASNAWILQIWGENSNSVMQGLHLCFSITMSISPLILAPFLSKKKEEQGDEHDAKNGSNHTIQTRSTGEDGNLPSLTIPYLFPVLLTLITAVALIIVYFDKKYAVTGASDKSPRRVSQISQTDIAIAASPQSKGARNGENSLAIIALAIVICIFNQSNECNVMSFTSSFIYYLTGDKERGAFMSSLVAGSNAVFRLLSVLTARYVAAHFMVIGHLSILVIGNVLLLLLAKLWVPIIPICFILIGAGQSSIFPSLLSLYNQKIYMTNRVLSTIMVADSFAAVIVPLFAAPSLEAFPLFFPIFNISVSLAAMSCFIFFFIKTKHIKIDREENNNAH